MAADKNTFGQGPEMLREPWLHHFVEKEEKTQLLNWMRSEGLDRPYEFDERIQHAGYLKRLGNDWFEKGDFRRALHCCLAAIHCLDWCPLEQQGQSESQRLKVAETMLPVLCNFTMIFLKRGDFANADKAATSGLLCSQKLPKDSCISLRAKLYYRRALARGEKGPQNDFEGSHSDLVEAARLDPGSAEIRDCLKTCKELRRQERREIFQKGPRYDSLSGKKETDGKKEPQQQQGDEPHHRPELSPAWEFFAMCIGKSLARARKCWLTMQCFLEWSKAKAADFGWLWTFLVMCIVLAVARYAYIAAEGSFPCRVFIFCISAVVIALFANVLWMQIPSTVSDQHQTKKDS